MVNETTPITNTLRCNGNESLFGIMAELFRRTYTCVFIVPNFQLFCQQSSLLWRASVEMHRVCEWSCEMRYFFLHLFSFCSIFFLVVKDCFVFFEHTRSSPFLSRLSCSFRLVMRNPKEPKPISQEENNIKSHLNGKWRMSNSIISCLNSIILTMTVIDNWISQKLCIMCNYNVIKLSSSITI